MASVCQFLLLGHIVFQLLRLMPQTFTFHTSRAQGAMQVQATLYGCETQGGTLLTAQTTLEGFGLGMNLPIFILLYEPIHNPMELLGSDLVTSGVMTAHVQLHPDLKPSASAGPPGGDQVDGLSAGSPVNGRISRKV